MSRNKDAKTIAEMRTIGGYIKLSRDSQVMHLVEGLQSEELFKLILKAKGFKNAPDVPEKYIYMFNAVLEASVKCLKDMQSFDNKISAYL